MKYGIFLLLLGTLFLSCQNNTADDGFEQCKYGKPEAIFDPEMEEVTSHRFRIKQKEGIEKVRFQSGMELTIYQSGCDYIKQEYQFATSPPPDSIDTGKPEYWISRTIESFQELGNLGTQFFSYGSWAQSIAEKAAEFKLAEYLEVQQGFYVKIDRIEGGDENILLVTLSENPGQ